MMNWNDTKAALLDGLPESKRSMLSDLLENQKTSFLTEYENDELENLINPPEPTFNKVILPIIRRVVPMALAQELIGVQPMTGPVGLVSTLRYRYGDQRSELETLIDDAKTVEEYLNTRPVSRKLKASWAIEPQQHLQSQHGLDLENELIAALSQDISNEIDQEIVNELMLMPYKGKSTVDEGYFYCPYVPRILTPTDIHYRAFDSARDALGVINFDIIA